MGRISLSQLIRGLQSQNQRRLIQKLILIKYHFKNMEELTPREMEILYARKKLIRKRKTMNQPILVDTTPNNQELGNMFGISRERIAQILHRIKSKGHTIPRRVTKIIQKEI